MKRRVLGVLLPLALVWSVACGPLGETGEQGEIVFESPSGWGNWGSPSELAEGGQLEFSVVSNYNGGLLSDDEYQAAYIIQATSSDPGVLEVVEFDRDKIVVRGVADGEVMLQVEARREDGTDIEDALPIPVREVARHTLSERCSSESELLYLPTQRLRVTSNLYSHQDNRLAGYEEPPVRVTGEGLELLELTSESTIRLNTGEAGEQGTLESTVTDDKLDVAVVAFAQVNGSTLTNLFGGDPEAEIRLMTAFATTPTVDGVPVCNEGLRSRLASETTDICEVTAMYGRDNDDGSWAGTSFVIDPLAPGQCDVEITIVHPESGQEFGAQLSFEVQPASSD